MRTACCARQHMLKHWCKLHTEMPASSQLSSIAKQQTQQLNWAYPKTKLKQNPWRAPHKNEGHPPAAVHSTTQVENACCRRHSVLGLSPVSCSKKVTSRPCAAQRQNKRSATSQPAQPGYKSTGARPWEVCVAEPCSNLVQGNSTRSVQSMPFALQECVIKVLPHSWLPSSKCGSNSKHNEMVVCGASTACSCRALLSQLGARAHSCWCCPAVFRETDVDQAHE